MPADAVPLIMGILIFFASLISLRLGFSVAIIEVILGVLFGNLGFIQSEPWMLYLATFGGIILTFLAGAEIDLDLMREKYRESFLIGFFSFIIPFVVVTAYTYYFAGWSLQSALIGGTALSTTSLAVVYSVLVESRMCQTGYGKIIMAATFVTDICTAIALSVLFLQPTVYTLVFIVVSLAVIYLAMQYSHLLFTHPLIKNRVVEPEVKFVLLLLLIFMYFGSLGNGQAVLPAFLLGLLIAKYRTKDRWFTETVEMKGISVKLRIIAYAVITPVFFIVGGMNVSVPMILSALGLFVILFGLKIFSKFAGVYKLSKKFIPDASMYSTLLMSTGLTFGTIASVFGLSMGYINQQQYSVLIGVVIASAVIPTFIAQKWFKPLHSEDLGDMKFDGWNPQ
ncbi:cation:proton antiporter [Methanoregula sp.]|jgi:Kef-type K+ transport system membrane component KefB|uniref:cation:proton antiporter n=1 Tax=Methanoregula sp. TaxID=2052170 RepID=UPI003C29902C